jgi:hypothetical protein
MTQARQAAHHHRLLGELLTHLPTVAQAHWLGEARHPTKDHQIRSAGPNHYRRGIYLLDDLTPIRDLLQQLQDTRHDHPHDQPTVLDDITRARLSRNTQTSSHHLDHSRATRLVSTWLHKAQTAAETMALNARGEAHDAKLERVNAELHALQAAHQHVLNHPHDSYRHHHDTARFHIRTYHHDGAANSNFVRKIGIILSGNGHVPTLEFAHARKPRRRPLPTPILHYQQHRLYSETAYRAAHQRPQ